jgi:hypothetical protein
MNKRNIIIAIVILLGLFLITIPFWNNGGKGRKAKDLLPGVHEAVISEVIQTSNYTYLQVEEEKDNCWIAVTKRQAKEGEIIYYTNGLEMNNFESKELGRTFPTIFFVEDVSSEPITGKSDVPLETNARKAAIARNGNISVKTVPGGINLSTLFENHSKYAGKEVTIRGIVTKYNAMIMGKNWVHIQDGSEYSGLFDLTITTRDSVLVGNAVTFTGTIGLNKDFGAGYFYKIIMEDGKASDIEPVK